MQKSTTIIGILEMLEDGYSYRDIQARFAIGNSTITDIKKKFAAMDIPLKELAVKTPKAIDLEEYFDLKKCKITNQETKTRSNGLELIKKKY